MRYFSTAQISESISETPEGYLVCVGVPIARLGEMEYLESEIEWSSGEQRIEPVNGKITLINDEASLFDPDTIASYEGKPVTIGHPDEFLGPDNWKQFAVGVQQNVRRGENADQDKLIADFLLTDREAIHAVKSGKLRMVSCGYDSSAVGVGVGAGRRVGIIGNHTALVENGRAGAECAVRDSVKPKEEKVMSKKETFFKKLGKLWDEEMPKEDPKPKEDELPEETDVKAVLAAIMERLDKLEGMKQEDEDMTEEEKKKAEEEAAAKKKSEDEAAVAAEAEEKAKQMDAALKDSEVISRAEILAPGIAKTGDIKREALKIAMKNTDTAEIINKLTGGKEIPDVSLDAIFIAGAELVKQKRNAAMVRSIDSFPALQAQKVTPESINEANAKRYAKN